GSTQIIVSSEGQTAVVAVTVRAVAPVPVASVIISPSSAVVQIGASIQLAATTRDSSNNVLSGRAVSWSSGNSSIASVSQTGVVEKFIPNPTALYMAAWVKYSPNFQGHNSLVNKIFHFWINDQAGAGNHLIISAQGSGSDPLYPAIRLQGVQAGGNQSGTTGN